jgi:hypothetical protein
LYHFCTLFDRNYLFKGIALYNSLTRCCRDFTLHILCMDDLTKDVLRALRLDKARLISLAEFEDPALTAVKATRSPVEFYWTCTPSLPLYLLRVHADIGLATYLDADLLFFRDPWPIFEEFGDSSSLLIEHRFPEPLKYMQVNGVYTVQMIIFRRDEHGLECLNWWRERCVEWCYHSLGDGRMGDQKYLDEWPVRFKKVHVLRHIGGGVAPWNVSQYEVTEREDGIWINEVPLIFYHFHQFQILPGRRYFYASDVYCRNERLPKVIYRRYVTEIEAAMRMVRAVAPNFSYGITSWQDVLLREVPRRYLPVGLKMALKKRGIGF